MCQVIRNSSSKSTLIIYRVQSSHKTICQAETTEWENFADKEEAFSKLTLTKNCPIESGEVDLKINRKFRNKLQIEISSELDVIMTLIWL